jgi:hypothetical protein
MARCHEGVPPLYDVEGDLVRCVLYEKGAVPEPTLVQAS